jgi:hypothetical protein
MSLLKSRFRFKVLRNKKNTRYYKIFFLHFCLIFKSIFTNNPNIKYLWKFAANLTNETEIRNW